MCVCSTARCWALLMDLVPNTKYFFLTLWTLLPLVFPLFPQIPLFENCGCVLICGGGVSSFNYKFYMGVIFCMTVGFLQLQSVWSWVSIKVRTRHCSSSDLLLMEETCEDCKVGGLIRYRGIWECVKKGIYGSVSLSFVASVICCWKKHLKIARQVVW